MQSLVRFPHSWITKPNRFQLSFDVLTDSVGIRKVLVCPEALFALEKAGFLKKPYPISVGVARRVVQVAHLKGAVRLVRLGQTPIDHLGDFDPDLLPGSRIQRRPRGSEDLYRVPVQMVLVVAIEPDARGEINAIELQK